MFLNKKATEGGFVMYKMLGTDEALMMNTKKILQMQDTRSEMRNNSNHIDTATPTAGGSRPRAEDRDQSCSLTP